MGTTVSAARETVTECNQTFDYTSVIVCLNSAVSLEVAEYLAWRYRRSLWKLIFTNPPPQPIDDLSAHEGGHEAGSPVQGG